MFKQNKNKKILEEDGEKKISQRFRKDLNKDLEKKSKLQQIKKFEEKFEIMRKCFIKDSRHT